MREPRILLVEDDESIRESLQELLETEGYSVATAANGKEALVALEKELPAVVLLDLMMPDMNGWELMAHMKESDRLTQVPVCIISAAADLAPPGSTQVFTKPLDIDQLLQTLKQCCGV